MQPLRKRFIFFKALINYTNPKGKLMEKRLGIIAIVITDKTNISFVNELISTYSDIIVARQGVPMPQRGISFITLIVEGIMNNINTLTGKLGRLSGVEVKTIVTKEKQQLNLE